jgi:WD40 repeat protein
LAQITESEFRHIHLKWFPDNQRLISSVGDGKVIMGMVVIQVSTGAIKRIAIGDDFSGDFYTSISPDGQWILFDARKPGSGIEIWKVGVHGGVPEQMTRNGGMMPSWSPDGRQFIFVCKNDIYLKEIKTGDERKIADSGGADVHPALSPDGRALVFNPVIEGNMEICTVSISGENMVNISNSPARDVYPSWSPDGSKIVFHSDRSGSEDLWIYDIQSKRLEQLTAGKFRDVCPSWSPDGSKIAFSSDRSGNLEVWVMDVRGRSSVKPGEMKYLGQNPPGITPELFAPGVVSTKDHVEFAGTFSPDFSEYFFTRRKSNTTDNRIFHVYYGNGRWTGPVPASFGYDCFEFEPHITPAGDRLFFGSRRPVDDSGNLTRGTRIWIMKKTGSGWSPPEYHGPPFDQAMFVCMACDGTLYNSGLTKSEPVDGEYGPWEKIASHLHGPYMHPCVGPDESFLIFDTDHPLDGRGKSLLISFREKDGSWGNIVSFRELEAFRHYEKFGLPMLTPDQKYLFFTCNGDIYWVDAKVIKDLRPGKAD